MEILKIENLAKNFYLHNAKKEIHSCQNINFTLEQGQFIGIVGLSGAGKSTILKCIHRTYLASTGKITYQSEAFGEVELTTAPERQILFLRKNEIGYVSQFLNVMPRTTAREHVMNALLERGVDAAEAKEKAAKKTNMVADFLMIMKQPATWLVAISIFTALKTMLKIPIHISFIPKILP